MTSASRRQKSPRMNGKRLGKGLEGAAAQARRVIHDNDVERLKQLLVDYPALLSWQDDNDHGGLLGFLGAYGDAATRSNQVVPRGATPALLIDAGADRDATRAGRLVDSRARALLELFQRKDLLPHTLKFLAGQLRRGRQRSRCSCGRTERSARP